MVREILNWTEKKREEINIIEDKDAIPKAFVLGCIDGVIDAAVAWYPVLLITCIVIGNQLKKLQKE